jgi:AmmeMemoRadiSam system protein A
MEPLHSTHDASFSIGGERARTLLAIARSGIAAAVGREVDPIPNEPWLTEPGASFVTLMLDGELRGCIGSVEPRRALGEDILSNAQAAALHDPRFAPLRADEFDRVRIEVSVLSPLERIAFASERDAIAQFRPGIDGIVLRVGLRRSTLLPQVWEMVPEPDRFLEALKRKLGVPAKYWGADVELFRYGVQHVHEDGYPEERAS